VAAGVEMANKQQLSSGPVNTPRTPREFVGVNDFHSEEMHRMTIVNIQAPPRCIPDPRDAWTMVPVKVFDQKSPNR